MMTTQEFADAIGRKRMAQGLGCGATAVSNGVVRGQFPASWYLWCRDAAKDAGIECPAHLFGMKGVEPDNDTTVSTSAVAPLPASR